MKRLIGVLVVIAAVAAALPAAALAQTLSRTVLMNSSTDHLAASGAWDLQYDLLSDNGYLYATRFRDCTRVNDTAIRCYWTRGRNITDQSYNAVYWDCLTDKDRVDGGPLHSYRTTCTLLFRA